MTPVWFTIELKTRWENFHYPQPHTVTVGTASIVTIEDKENVEKQALIKLQYNTQDEAREDYNEDGVVKQYMEIEETEEEIVEEEGFRGEERVAINQTLESFHNSAWHDNTTVGRGARARAESKEGTTW